MPASPLAKQIPRKTPQNLLVSRLADHRGLVFPVLIVASVAIIVTPLSPVVMDALLACNLALAVVILLTGIQVRKPLDFNVFPTLLLGTTLFRLVLNIASTRLILTESANHGTHAAGGIIQSFGHFVSGGSLMVGLVMFAILLTIQFVVITNGSTRVSEVAARFVLDGLPGRQAAIDAELQSGTITDQQATSRRNELLQETDFYGAMDGAGRFVRGDALAGLVIVAINIIGGLYVGVVEHGMSLTDAGRIFTTLTIGDGLVSQLPAFLIALATGLIVTRSSTQTDLSTDVVNQVTGQPVALVVAAILLAALSFTGLPAFPLLALSLGCFAIAFFTNTDPVETEVAPAAEKQTREESQDTAVELLELRLGLRVTRLVRDHTDLLDRMKKLRSHLARELGIMMPPVRISDSLHLGAREYQFLIRGVPVATNTVYADALLAIEPDHVANPVPGIDAVDPAYQRPARWIETTHRDQAEARGYNIVTPSAVVATHLAKVVRSHASELLTRQHVHQLVARLKKDSPQLVGEAIPNLVSISTLHRVLTLLLKESVPVSQLETIIEQLADYSDQSLTPAELLGPVRESLSRAICQKYLDSTHSINAIVLDPECEMRLSNGLTSLSNRTHSTAQQIEQLRKDITTVLADSNNEQLVVLCSAEIRSYTHSILVSPFPDLAVLSFAELPSDTNINHIATVGSNDSQSHDSLASSSVVAGMR